MRNRQSALMCTVPMAYSIDAPVNHGDRIAVDITTAAGKRRAILRRALPGDTVIMTDLEDHAWTEEGSGG